MDDRDILCHPALVLLFLLEFDVANVRVGAERNPPEDRSHLSRQRLGLRAS